MPNALGADTTGYGFVMFENQDNATAALMSIQSSGQHEVAYAKLSNNQT